LRLFFAQFEPFPFFLKNLFYLPLDFMEKGDD
jgi:hypothetical protein